MRVLHAIPSLDLANGGPPRSTYSLCLELARCGAHVRLMSRDAAGWRPADLEARSTGEGTMEVVLVPGTKYLTRGWNLIEWTDIVHFQSVWRIAHAVLGTRCRRLAVPYVLAPRGELDVWSMNQKSLKKRIFLDLLGKRFIRGSAALHLLNEDEAQGFAALGIEHPRFIVPNGIDPEEWETPCAEPPLRERFPQIGTRTVVLFFARMHHKKGGALLAEAFTRIADAFPDSFLIFAGADYGERSRIVTLLAGAAAQRSLVLDPQDGERRRRLLMDADIVALPSFQEGHPRTVLEAGFLGKSLLITRECHVPELTDHGAAEVVRPNADSVATGLARVLGDPSYRLEIGRRAAAVIRNNYTWHTIARRQMEAYAAILEEERRRD